MYSNHNPNPQDLITVVNVSQIDRWFIHQRLQELMINSWCSASGELLVEINNFTDALLVHSIVKQFVAPRKELVDWLERCWQMEVFPKYNH
ncbi:MULTISPECIES: Asr1405/Asl0597 family protein [Okeania]|uniref:Uncharacterized protein n=1 Tax=Okeania hirsuta TaxID=1458930 RepID=A0A3N6R2U0_9CYAN|nr:MULTISPECIES: Asr1405/Asl0597 family protein [Okeania]NEP38462.1 hypothetical protein [Okeania sp. SIO2H7]NET15242.1 hypothetical protein [Okeania sp. SIO1H6]NEP70833.1 hypothetical protein [Okeania sp. SIO2G5]NEP86595.1 hypothetical protein [Okeania sp. SIO2C2]NEP92388.1 hypothetical protein [Okeania sp. SIO2F5]